jgi:hypothetical protein
VRLAQVLPGRAARTRRERTAVAVPDEVAVTVEQLLAGGWHEGVTPFQRVACGRRATPRRGVLRDRPARDCSFAAGGDHDEAEPEGTGSTALVPDAVGIGPVVLSVLHAFASPGSATITCFGNPGFPTQALQARITAVQ